MAYVKILKPGIVVENHVHLPGDVVLVPDRRADAMVKWDEGEIVPGPASRPEPAPIEHAVQAAPENVERTTSPRRK